MLPSTKFTELQLFVPVCPSSLSAVKGIYRKVQESFGPVYFAAAPTTKQVNVSEPQRDSVIQKFDVRTHGISTVLLRKMKNGPV